MSDIDRALQGLERPAPPRRERCEPQGPLEAIGRMMRRIKQDVPARRDAAARERNKWAGANIVRRRMRGAAC